MASQDETQSNTSPVPDDLTTIRRLVKLMARYDLTAIDLGDGPSRIRLRRRGSEPVGSAGMSNAQPAPTHVPQASPTANAVSPTPPPSLVPAETKSITIDSPMVGTFYSSSAPDAPPFVSVGSTVRPDMIVCVIEAMKVFTDIPAGVSGSIAEVLVKNGQAVEFGQPLFRVKPD